MDELTTVQQFSFDLFGVSLVFNTQTIIMTWIVMALLVLFGFLASRKMGLLPNPLQVVAELLVKIFKDLTVDALGKERADKFFPLVCGLFMFLLICNWIGIIPELSEPTKDINTPLSLGIMGFFIAHYTGIRTKGIKGYLKSYAEPIFIMFPLNIIGELSKVISISFRLFGNIRGGSIIILVVSYLVYGLVLPPIFNIFFGLFIGTIQAFVFTMLTLVYISLQVN